MATAVAMWIMPRKLLAIGHTRWQWPADLGMAKHAIDAVALLVFTSVQATGDCSLDLPFGKVDTDRVGIIALV